MSENVYLDTYAGWVYDSENADTRECTQLVLVRAVDFDHARSLVLKNADTEHVEVRRHYCQRRINGQLRRILVSSPSDQCRALEKARKSKRRTTAPQYRRKKRA